MKSKDIRFHPARFIDAPELHEKYDEFNETYFNSRLPVVRIGYYPDIEGMDGEDAYGCTIHLSGYKHTTHILLNPYFRGWSKTTEATLLHEMIHVKMPKRVGHGPKFQRELRRLIREGAFDDLL